MPLEVGIFAVK